MSINRNAKLYIRRKEYYFKKKRSREYVYMEEKP